MLLERAGVEVSLFEANNRPGGRLHTADEGDGVLYEAGGEWIDADHHRIIALLKEFGHEADPRGNWPNRLSYAGKHVSEDLVWNDALEDDLRVEATAKEMCQTLKSPPWSNCQAAEWDRGTVADFLREHTESVRGLWWVTSKYRSDEGEDLDKIGLLGWLTGMLNYLDRDGDEVSAYRFPGGASRICEQMLNSLKAAPNYGSVLTRVTQNANGVTLKFENGNAQADRVVLTLPPPALERIIFEPALSVGKRCAVEACRLSRAVKICWHFKSAWWKEAGWGGNMLTDGPIQQTWDGSLGEAAVLNAYLCGQQAVDWMRTGDPVNASLYELAQMFPEAQSEFIRGWSHDWISDPHAGGAFSNLAPGYVLEHMAEIAPPENRIHFAGEHTATWVGFIEGALESAERVTQEVLSA